MLYFFILFNMHNYISYKYRYLNRSLLNSFYKSHETHKVKIGVRYGK